MGAAAVTEVRVWTIEVPTDGPEADGTLAWDSTSVTAVEVAAEGEVGLGWTYGPRACARFVTDVLASTVHGLDATRPVHAWDLMVRALRNAGRPGVAGMALSAVDCAVWDLCARLRGAPLHALLGGNAETVTAYGSGGFTNYDDRQLTEQLHGWTHEHGLTRVKMKIGENRGADPDRDLERVRLARVAIGPEVELFVDANGAYGPALARRMARELERLGVTWFEEPVSSDDLAGLRRIRSATTMDVAAGEYGYDVGYFERMCAAEAVDCVQVDVTRCGGFTEFTRIAAVAAAHGLEVSGHCAPHLVAPALAAVPNARHLEWFHDHVRIEAAAFVGTTELYGGQLRLGPEPGHGIALRDTAGWRRYP